MRSSVGNIACDIGADDGIQECARSRRTGALPKGRGGGVARASKRHNGNVTLSTGSLGPVLTSLIGGGGVSHRKEWSRVDAARSHEIAGPSGRLIGHLARLILRTVQGRRRWAAPAMTLAKAAGSTGFVKCASNPASSARCLSCDWPHPVTATTTTCRCAGSCRMRRHVS